MKIYDVLEILTSKSFSDLGRGFDLREFAIPIYILRKIYAIPLPPPPIVVKCIGGGVFKSFFEEKVIFWLKSQVVH